MDSLGWRFLVLADLNGKSDGPVVLPSGSGENWLGSLGISLDLQVGGQLLHLDFAEEKVFRPKFLSTVTKESLDDVLHHPDFQRVESAYRGLKQLREHAGEKVEIQVLSTTRKGLVESFRKKVYEPEMADLSDRPISLILADFDFTHRSADLGILGELSEMAAGLQAPLVAAASPEFFDLRQITMLPKLSDLPQRLNNPAHAAWQKFQKDDRARWVGLTVNRYLLRDVYEARGEIPAEKVDRNKPETFLWGRGIWPVASAFARSAGEYDHALSVSGNQGGLFTDLPSREIVRGANKVSALSTEVEIPDELSMELSRAGFIPLVGRLGGGVLMLPLVVNAYREEPGKLTVTGTLAYQMELGRMANFLSSIVYEVRRAEQDPATFLKTRIAGHLGKLAGEKPEEAVAVEVKEAKDPEGQPLTLAEIKVEPAARLEGMSFRFYFNIPLPR